jgi:ribose 5-phosphate isomerase B
VKIAIGSDHAGYAYKELLKSFLISLGHQVRDFGTDSPEPVDYPQYIRPVAEAVANGEFERGIVLGGSGNGEAIVANKVRGIRCALCWSEQTARWSREHNDANVLSIGERTISPELAVEIVRVWLNTPFAGGRHARRVGQIE